MEDDLWWKTTIYGRKPLMEDNLRRKMTFEGGLCLKKFWDSALPYTVIAVILKKTIFFNRSNTHFIQKKWLCVNRTALWASSSYARVSLESFFQPNPMRFSINVILDPKCLSHSDPTWILYPSSDLMRAKAGCEIRYFLDLINQMFQ